MMQFDLKITYLNIEHSAASVTFSLRKNDHLFSFYLKSNEHFSLRKQKNASKVFRRKEKFSKNPSNAFHF